MNRGCSIGRHRHFPDTNLVDCTKKSRKRNTAAPSMGAAVSLGSNRDIKASHLHRLDHFPDVLLALSQPLLEAAQQFVVLALGKCQVVIG